MSTGNRSVLLWQPYPPNLPAVEKMPRSCFSCVKKSTHPPLGIQGKPRETTTLNHFPRVPCPWSYFLAPEWCFVGPQGIMFTAKGKLSQHGGAVSYEVERRGHSEHRWWQQPLLLEKASQHLLLHTRDPYRVSPLPLYSHSTISLKEKRKKSNGFLVLRRQLKATKTFSCADH